MTYKDKVIKLSIHEHGFDSHTDVREQWWDHLMKQEVTMFKDNNSSECASKHFQTTSEEPPKELSQLIWHCSFFKTKKPCHKTFQ